MFKLHASSDEVRPLCPIVQWVNNAIEQVPVSDIIVKFRYNARCHWLKEHADETVVCFVNRVGFEN